MSINSADSALRALRQRTRPLCLVLLLGALARIALLCWFHGEPLYIDDERSYNAIAMHLVEDGAFASGEGTLTSLRPPLYPAFVAAVYSIGGLENYTAVRAVQGLFALGLVVVVYLLAERLYNRSVASIAALATCFYPPLLFTCNLLLTEILFALLLCCCCLLLQRYLQQGSVTSLAMLGAAMGLATLTRSILWLFPPFLFMFLLMARSSASWQKRICLAAVPLLPFALTLAPWAIRNTRLHQTFTVVDVMGGRNFMMGNYEYTPLYRAWDAIALQGAQSWHHVLRSTHPEAQDMTQGQLDKLALRYGLDFAVRHPGLTAQRAVVKFFDFWQLDRALIAGLARGYWGDLRKPAVVSIASLVIACYVAAVGLGIVGCVMRPPADLRMHIFFLLLVGFVWAVHTAVFAHSRYHLPLMPIVLIYASAAWCERRVIWQERRSWRCGLSVAACAVLAASWVWQAVLVDIPHFLTP